MTFKQTVLLGVVLSAAFALPAAAQFKPGAAEQTKLGEATIQHYQVGVDVKALSGPCKGIVATVPIPVEWPEQQVKISKEEIAPQIRTSEKTIEGIKHLVFTLASLPDGAEARAVVTFEIARSAVLPPKDTKIYSLPDAKKLDRTVRPWLNPSPQIDSRSSKIVALAKELVAGKTEAWAQVQAIYDHVRDKVAFDARGSTNGALAALQAGRGNHEDMVSLFIALCRAAGVPARTVWVPQYCYAEFCLVDGTGEAHWFPCEVAGNRSFGGIDDQRPVLQKGDNFQSPENKRERVRFMPEHLTGAGGRPQVQFIRELGAGR